MTAFKTLANTPIIGPLAGYGWHAVRARGAAPEILADYLRTRRDTAFLRATAVPADTEKTAVVLALGDDMIYRIKLEAMLAVALKLHGWRVIVLQGSRRHSLGRRYFSAFGIDRFAFFEDFPVTAAEMDTCHRAVEEFAGRANSFQEIKAWTFRSSWIGPHILSTLSRKRFQGAPNVADPETREQIFAALPMILQHVFRAEKAIAALRPRLALVNEANYSSFGPLVDATIAAGAPVIQFTQPWRDDALMLKRLTAETRRHHPSSVSPSTFTKLVQAPWTEKEERALGDEFAARYGGRWFLQGRNQPGTEPRPKQQLVAELGLDPDKKTAVVFSHILWDANLFYGDDLFEDYGDWFVQTTKAACGNDKVNWVIKLHPANIWKRAWEKVDGEYAETALIRMHIGRLPEHVKLLPADTKISTLSLFEMADYGVTVRGTAGMEIACFGVPVFTAGTGRYSGLGFTEDSASASEYLAKLARIETFPPLDDRRANLARWHAYAVFRLRHWSMKSFRSVFAYPKAGAHPLASNLVAVANSDNGLSDNDDLDCFAGWAEDFSEVDYIKHG